MTDEVSSSTRVAVTVVLAAAATTIAASLLIMSLITFNNFRDTFVDSMNNSEYSIAGDLVNQESVELTIIYKNLISNSAITGYTIESYDTSNALACLTWSKLTNEEQALNELISPRNASRRFKVNVERKSDGSYWLKLTEVVR